MGDFFISAKVEVKDRNPDARTSYKCLLTCILNWHVIHGPVNGYAMWQLPGQIGEKRGEKCYNF
jgi:hypothetical protein